MLYYRFRPPLESCIKELIYDELFFCSTEESNDPFDSKTFYIFSGDKERWKRLLSFAWGKTDLIKIINLEKSIGKIIKICPLSFSQLLSTDFYPVLCNCINLDGSLKGSKAAIIELATRLLIERVRLYYPPNVYFASFSKLNNEPLMWSHYAGKYQGFCLIFKSIDNQLFQYKNKLKKSISRNTARGLAPHMSYAIPESFKFMDVSYVNETKSLDAFLCFPKSVIGNTIKEEKINKIVLEQKAQYLQKHSSWAYEKESRLILESSLPWLFGEHINLSPQERLFYFEPTQLVGVIIGSRIQPSLKSRLGEIIKERIDRIAKGVNYSRTIFDFVIFESKLSTDSRSLQINPLEIRGLGNKKMTSAHKDFTNFLKKWENGCGLLFDKNSCRKVQID